MLVRHTIIYRASLSEGLMLNQHWLDWEFSSSSSSSDHFIQRAAQEPLPPTSGTQAITWFAVSWGPRCEFSLSITSVAAQTALPTPPAAASWDQCLRVFQVKNSHHGDHESPERGGPRGPRGRLPAAAPGWRHGDTDAHLLSQAANAQTRRAQGLFPQQVRLRRPLVYIFTQRGCSEALLLFFLWCAGVPTSPSACCCCSEATRLFWSLRISLWIKRDCWATTTKNPKTW